MSVLFKLVSRRDLSKGAAEGSKLFYAQSVASSKTDLDQLCTMINDRSTVSSADVKAVLDCLVHVMRQELQQGRIVQLGEFGNFRMTVGSKGSQTAEEFTASMLKKAKYSFYPGKALRNEAKLMTFRRIDNPQPVTSPDVPSGGGEQVIP